MKDPINLAWAVSANYAQLGARLEAYAKTKAQITTLKACVASSCSPRPPITQIPPKIVASIADALKDIVYLPKIKRWLSVQKCVERHCRREDHFTKAELLDYESWSEVPLAYDNEILYEESQERHHDAVSMHLAKITRNASNKFATRFKKSKKVFALDFGVELCFTALKHYSSDAYFQFADISAFLTIPIIKSPLVWHPGPCNVTYTVQHVLDPEKIPREVSVDTEQRFKKAIKALRLDAPHTDVAEGKKKLQASYSEDEDDSDSDGDHITEQVANHDDEAQQTNPHARTGTPSSDHSNGKRLAKSGIHCIDCGSDACQGRFTAVKPVMMLLGSGQLDAYDDYD